MIFDLISNALRNLKRKKLRSFLMMLGIIIGITSVTTVLSIGKSGEDAITGEFDRFGLNGLTIKGAVSDSGIKGELTASCVTAIEKKVRNVKAIMPVIYYYGSVAQSKTKSECVVWGIGDNAKSVISQTTIYGSNLATSDLSGSTKNCIIDNQLAKKYFGRENVIGKELQVFLNGYSVKLKVKGVVDSKDSLLTSVAGEFIPSFIYIPYTTLQRIYKVSEFDQLVVSVKDSADIDTVGNSILSVLTGGKPDSGTYYAENMVKQKKKIENIIAIVTTIVSAVAGISLVVGGLGIMTVMLAAVTERTREIGLKKAVGATNAMIVCEFLTESVILTLLGGMAGVGLSAAIVSFANHVLGFQAEINGRILFIALIFSAIIGIIFSVYPARKASQLSPITALRCE